MEQGTHVKMESIQPSAPISCMSYGVYKKILEAIYQLTSTQDATRQLSVLFPNISSRTLGSIYAQEYQRKTKKTHYKHYLTETVERYYQRYLDAVEAHENSGILLRISSEGNISPSLLSRIILEQYLIKKTGEYPTKQQITKMMKDTSLIDNGVLALEIYLCVLNDDNYGPLADTIKHSIGHEYECKLRKILEEHKITFLDEEQMRAKGYDKTPDFKLEVPFATNGFIVNWIESKASFGDEESYQGYLKDQFWSYWNRFGSGMVIYWFGYLEELDTNEHKGILLHYEFPKNVMHMDPSSIRDSES